MGDIIGVGFRVLGWKLKGFRFRVEYRGSSIIRLFPPKKPSRIGGSMTSRGCSSGSIRMILLPGPREDGFFSMNPKMKMKSRRFFLRFFKIFKDFLGRV